MEHTWDILVSPARPLRNPSIQHHLDQEKIPGWYRSSIRCVKPRVMVFLPVCGIRCFGWKSPAERTGRVRRYWGLTFKSQALHADNAESEVCRVLSKGKLEETCQWYVHTYSIRPKGEEVRLGLSHHCPGI